MLTRTMATDYSPGINLKHDLAGASWTFLMPRLELEHVVCIGKVSQATLTTLSRISRQVTVVWPNLGTVDAIQNEGQQHFGNVSVVVSLAEVLPVVARGADLVYIADRANVRRLYNEPRFQDELSRLLNQRGLIYYELEPLAQLLGGGNLDGLGDRFGPSQLIWLTPWQGEMKTAVPVSDRRMIDYFFKHRLYSPSLNISALKHMLVGRKSARKRTPGQRQRNSEPQSLVKKLRVSSKPLLRAAAVKTVRTVGRVERLSLKQARAARRYGVFMKARAGDGELDMKKPPAYLRSIASSAGIEIGEHRWGFSARGRYSSRKLLFYLFKDREQNADDLEANYIVKMVRDPVYNARLENEYRALALLDERGVRGKAVFPKAEFFGHHNGLAIAGESHIDGVPFRAETEATADCPYARDVVDWLIHLGAATACPSSPTQVATVLEELLSSFAELYSPSDEVYGFLADQITTVGRFQGEFPLVFQHGDPGTWNIFVTKERRVAFLDWEAAEPQGMPLWDLFYFLRSYSTWVARKGGTRDTLKGFQEQFLSEGPMAQFVAETTERYIQQVALPRAMVEPLFYTCWMHRALKQATSLPVNKLATGHYLNLLRFTIEERHNSYTLHHLFSELDPVNHRETG